MTKIYNLVYDLRSTNFRGFLFSRVKKNCISRVLIFANWSYFEFSRVLIFANWSYFEFSRELIFAVADFYLKKFNFINFAVHKKPSEMGS